MSKKRKEEDLERRVIDQILKKLEITLQEDQVKALTDEILSAHHAELSVEKERADQASTSLSELQKTYDSAIKNSESLDALKSEITSLRAQNKQTIADIEAKYQAKLLDNAIELALTQAGARNNKAAAALIDKSNLKLSEDGSVFGLSEMIETVKKDDATSFLFESPQKEPQPQQEEKKVYNYIPQADATGEVKDSTAALYEATAQSPNSQIQGW